MSKSSVIKISANQNCSQKSVGTFIVAAKLEIVSLKAQKLKKKGGKDDINWLLDMLPFPTKSSFR